MANLFSYFRLFKRFRIPRLAMGNPKPDAPSVYDQPFTLRSLDGKPVDFSQWKGKKLLVVNVASNCGYARQYEGLQKLWEESEGRYAIVGFPSDDFGGQEKDTAAEIGAYCTKNFGVTFPLFEKNSVTGSSAQPLFSWLTEKNKNGWNAYPPAWNFTKFLLNERGQLVAYFGPNVEPEDRELVDALK